MNIKKTVVASLIACMLPAVVMAKDISVGVSMALFDDNFLTILRTAMQKEMQKDGVKAQVEDAKGDVSQQLQQVQNFIGQASTRLSSTRWIPTRSNRLWTRRPKRAFR